MLAFEIEYSVCGNWVDYCAELVDRRKWTETRRMLLKQMHLIPGELVLMGVGQLAYFGIHETTVDFCSRLLMAQDDDELWTIFASNCLYHRH